MELLDLLYDIWNIVSYCLRRTKRSLDIPVGSRPWKGICSVKPPQPSLMAPMYAYLGVKPRSSNQVPYRAPS